MKKFLIGSISLLMFSISITIVQMSCSKSTAQSNNVTTQVNKIIYGLFGNGAANGIYTANYDGSNQTLVPINLPTPYFMSNSDQPSLSPDGSKIFFIGIELNSGVRSLFSCDLGGGNLTRIIDYPVGYQPKLGGAF